MEIASEDQENTDRPMPLAPVGSNRRNSEQGLLSKKMNESKATTKRRQTIAAEPSGAREMKENTTAATPSKTPSKHRLNLGAASSYYFKGVTKNPFEVAASAKKKLNSSMQMEQSFTGDQSFDEQLAGYNGSVADPDDSFMTLGGQSSSSDGSDMLNKSTLSDTTELTASNFVFATSSRHLLSHSAQQHRAPEKTNEKEEPEEVQVPTSLALLKDSASKSGADDSSRFPLETINANNKRRNTLPPGAMAGASSTRGLPPSTAGAPGSGAARRESMQGPSPRTKVNLSPGSLRDFAATMRNSRLKRKQERDEDISRRLSVGSEQELDEDVKRRLSVGSEQERDEGFKRRLSVGSEVSTTEEVASVRQASGNKQRYSIASATTDMEEVASVQQASGNKQRYSLASTTTDMEEVASLQLASGNKQRYSLATTATNISVRLPSLSPASRMDISVHSAGEKSQGRDDESDVSRRSLDDLFDGLLPQEEGDTAELLQQEDGHTAELTGTSFSSNALVASLEQDSGPGTATSRTSMSPASTITTAPSISNAATSASTGGSPGPLPSAIAFEYARSPPKSPRAETTSPSSAKTTTPTKKMTPSKLKGSPHRMLNPKNLESPAKNTRSASKTKALLNDSSQGDGDTAELVDMSFTSNASVASLEQESGTGAATVTSRTSMSPASTVTTAASISNSASRLSAASMNARGSPGPLPSAIAFESAHSPPKSLRAEAASPFRPSSAKTTTTPTKKMTPSKLNGSPHRVLNPKSLESPAKNTRSASRTKNLSYDDSQGDGDTAELMDLTFTSNASVASLEQESGTGAATVASGTSMPPASTVTTAPSISKSMSRLAATPTSTEGSPGPLPSAVAFEYAHSPPKSLRADATSPFRPSSAKTTTTPTKKMTPSKLKGSPHRMLNPKSLESPAKNTRSASRTKDMSNDSSAGKRMRDSIEDDVSGEQEGNHDVIDQSLDFSFVNEGPKRRKSSVSSFVLNSALKKAGSVRRNGSARKTVAFGSPDIMEFNKGSPSKNWTPVPKKLAKQMNAVTTMVDSTVEIEADMNALLNNVGADNFTAASRVNAYHAGNTPIVSKMSPLDSTEPTVELESNVHDLFAQPPISTAAPPIDNTETTIELESNVQDLFAQPPVTSKTNISGSAEATVELEGNVQDLFAQPPISTATPPIDGAEKTVELESNVQDLFAQSLVVSKTDLTGSAEATVELENNVQDFLAQPPIATETPPLDNVEATVELESSVQDLFAQPPIASKSTPFNDIEETVELESNVQDLLGQPQEALDAQSDMSVDSPTAQMDITEPEHTVDLEVDMASLLAYTDTKKESRRKSISQLETFLDTEDDAMSMDVDTSAFGGQLKADEDNTIELECDMQALLGAAHGEKVNQLQLSVSDSPSTMGSRPRRSSVSTGRFSLAPKSRLSLTAEGDVIINDLSDIEQADSTMDGSVASMSPQAEVEVVNEALDLNEVELFLASGLTVDAKHDASDILTEVSESTHALVMPVTTDAMNAILAEVCSEVDARIDPEVDLGLLLSSCDENRENYLTLQRALRAQDQDVCGQLERLGETVRTQVESEWLDWLVSVAESLKGPFDGMQEEINEFESRINEATELISETREILSTMESKAIQKAKRKSLDVRMVSEGTHNLVICFHRLNSNICSLLFCFR
jgi:hypothetical protein